MAGLGMMEKHIASCLGISQDTFIQKKKAHPELVEALARGTAKVVREIARGLKINATTGTDREPGGSVAAQKFYLQAKGGYVEEKTPERGRDKPLVIRLELPNINRGPIQKVVDA